MSAPSFRSLSQGFSQIVDAVSDLIEEGYREVESTVTEWSGQAGSVAGAVAQQAGQVAADVRKHPENYAQCAAEIAFLPPSLGATHLVARGLGRMLRNPVLGRTARHLGRQLDSAGIGRPLTVPAKQLHRGLDLLGNSLNELFGFGPGRYLVSPAGTEHMNPVNFNYGHSRTSTRTFHRVEPTEISIREYHRMDSAALAELLRHQTSGGER